VNLWDENMPSALFFWLETVRILEREKLTIVEI
jgi:hypothetical protein